jgi:ATP-dependent RNA helicase DDX52/ROK1
MDILKILTRGVISGPKNASGTTTTNLPSAGNQPHPQLFHDDVGAMRIKKRKRHEEVESVPEVEDDSDVDFFAPKKDKISESRPESGASQDTEAGTPPKRKFKLLSEEECQQLLRSHRLKFTVLSSHTDKAAKVSKKKKKKDEPVKQEAKDRKKQLYPQPLRSFSDLELIYGMPPQLSQNIAKQGFRIPTEVQMASLPLLLQPEKAMKRSRGIDDVEVFNGVHFLAVAPTGSGKTMSFLIPAITSVMQSKLQNKDHLLQAIIVAPTRELASQIVNEGRRLAVGTGVRIHLMRKGIRIVAQEVVEPRDEETEDDGESEDGSDASEEEEEVDEAETQGSRGERGILTDILVTTPKSLLNVLSKGKPGIRRALPSVRSLILDEADVLLDPFFEKQTMGIWKACTNPDLQLTFWSATIASSIESIITKNTSEKEVRPLVRLVVGLKDTAVPNITHKLIYTATEQGKLLALRQLLHPVSGVDSGPPLRPPFLVFTQTVERAQALHEELKYDIPPEAGGSARIAALHSTMNERARAKVMAAFRAGEVWILITTDVLARGVDFAGVNGVVSYDVPGSAAAYVHRAGRTGRAGREGGVAVTFYTKEDIPFVKSVANVIAASDRQAGKKATSDEGGVQQWLLDALPKVAKEDKRRLKVRGVETRRSGGKAKITTKSAWDRRRENNRKGAIAASKRRKHQEADPGSDSEWGGLAD